MIYNKSSEQIIQVAFGLTEIYEGIEIEDILSRKKQIVPNIMDALDKS